MFESNSKIETRIFVKIFFSETGISAIGEVRYFRNEMTVEFYQKWKWYFEYRAALLRVKFPKAYIKLETGPYEYVLPEDKYKEKIKNRYLSDKRQLTKFKNKLNSIRKNWNELFPIEENPDWIKVTKKLEWYESQYESSKKEYDSVLPSLVANKNGVEL